MRYSDAHIQLSRGDGACRSPGGNRVGRGAWIGVAGRGGRVLGGADRIFVTSDAGKTGRRW